MSAAKDHTVAGLLEFGERSPDKPALVVNGREVTYRRLLARSAAVARLLRVNAVAPGERVLYSTQDKLAFTAAFLGITGSGRIAVPVPDGATLGTVQDMAAASEASAMIVADDQTPPSGVAALPLSDLGDSTAPESVINTRSLAEFADSRPTDDAPALLLFTSGTTSKKKGVLLTHGSLMSATRHINEVMGIDATTREYVAIPLHHSFGLGRLRCVLQVGGTLVFDNGMFDPAKLLHSVSRLRVNALSSVPAGFALFMGRLQPQLARLGGAIRVVEIGSAAMPTEHKEKLLELLPNARLFMHYGLTEASRTTFVELRRDRNHWDTVGRAAPGVTVRIVDEHGERLGPHEEGEIVVQGGHVMAGYFRDPERTRRAFSKHGFRTGDFGFLDDRGFLHLRGRRDDMINYGGVKISPVEVEVKLQAVLGDVEFAVVGVRDPAGMAGKIPVVAYVPSGRPITFEWLLKRCRGVVDKNELPRALMPVDEIPRTENGKVMRRVLEERIDPASLSRELVTMWQRVLGVAKVGILDSFFDLGGDSLQAAMLVNELQERLGEVVDVSTLFEAPTVTQLAEYLETEIPREGPPVSVRAGHLSIPQREGTGPAPVSLAQQRLWFVEQWIPGTSAYQLPEAIVVHGALDVAALRRSFTELVRRHESLRTTFAVVDDNPVQIVADTVDLEFKIERLDGQIDLKAVARRLLHDELGRPFDLERGPLFRVRLLQTADRQYLLIFNAHHIIFDGWSRDLLWRELSALYEAFEAGRPSPLPQLPIQYSDFAVWQRRRLQGDVLEPQLTYWRKQLDGLETLQLLPDYPRPAVQSFRGAVESLVLPERTTRAIRTLCAEQQVTVFMLMLAVFKALLHRYTGQDDIVVGSPVAGRNRKQVEGLIGFFVNMLVLRTNLSDAPSGRELISRVRKVALDAMRHHEVPFEKLVEELEPERDQTRNPLFQVAFLHRRRQQPAMQLGDVTLGHLEVDRPTSRFDLEACVFEEPTAVTLEFTYSTDLYESATIRRMLSHFQVLLDGILEDTDAPVSRLPLLEPAERHQLLVAWNDTVVASPDDKCVHELFEEQVERTPDAVAAVFGEKSLTYGQLNERANQVAHTLRGMGVGVEDLVGLCMERSLEMVVGLLGILKAGAAYVPLDPTYPRRRLAYMLEDSGVSALLTQASLLQTLPDRQLEVLCLDRDASAIGGARSTNPSRLATADNLAYVIYTSGTTGRPKGVEVTHGSLLNLVRWHHRVYALTPADRATQLASIGFDACVWEIWPYLTAGASVHIPDGAARSDPDALWSWLKERHITMAFLPTPLAEAALVKSIPSGLSLRALLTGGDRLQRSPEESLPFEFVNHYGPTENAVVATCARVGALSLPPIGRPIDNVRTYILDRNMNPVPAGVPGELYIGGSSLARGYLRRPGLTAERFLPDPFGDERGARLYRTGDVARYLDSGEIDFLGRVDHQVKLRGFRIELGEIEAVLGQFEQVREAVVLCRSDAPGQKRLVAYVVSDGDAEPSRRELREHLTGKLPEYMVPSAFVFLDALPLTPNGKVNRAALPAPGLGRQAEDVYVTPRTPAERVLAGIWSELLRVDRVGVNDNFFELGGDSILSIQVIARAREAGLHLAARQIFQHQTVGALAAVAGTEGPDRLVLAEQEPVVGELPLTPIEHWFFEQELTDAHHFNQSMLVSVRERLAGSVVERAVEALLAHHDALRLRFERSEAGWKQVNAEPGGPVPFECVDLSALAEAEQSAAITTKAETLQASLDLSEGPLVRVALFDLGEDRPGRLLIVIHHLAVDGVSWRILLEDLQRACEQVIRGEEVGLPAKTTSYRQWSDRLAAHADSEEMLAELEWWADQPWEEAGSLPVAGSVEQNTAGLSRSQTIELSEEETRSLLQEVPRAYNTQIDDVLLTALVQAFAPWTGRGSLLVNLEGHGREALFDDVDLSRTVGWLTAIYPVLLDGGDADGRLLSEGAALKSVKEQLRGVPNRGIGYGLLRYLGGDATITAELAALPHPEVSFNYLGQFDQMVDERSMFGQAGESKGAVYSPDGLRAHLIDVVGAVTGGRLLMKFAWGSALHEAGEIAELAERYRAALVGLIAHCTAPESGGSTPSDFPLATVNQRTLDELVAEYGPREIKDLYPLSPMQQGMMFHSASEPTSGVYVQQMRFGIDGLDAETFKRSWETIVARHPVLRTSLVGVGSKSPLQLVHGHVELPVAEHDLRELTEDEQEAWLETFLGEDRVRGFDLGDPPLMRLSLVRRGEERYEFMWTFHHILLDGWSVPRVINEVFAIYGARRRNEDVALPRLHPYREYIAWLQEQDPEEARSFWQRTLGGFATPTRLGETLGKTDAAGTTERYGQEKRFLPAELTESLRGLASRHQVTMNTLVAGAWSLVLSRYSGASDVVFGTVVSGRPADLDGVESMVGMFVNTLPLRVSVPDDQVLVEWLRDLQEHQSELRQYEYSPLWQVQQEADLPAGTPLFDSLYVFENYPVDVSAVNESDLNLTRISPVERTGFPLMLTVIGTSEFSLKLTYDCDRFDADLMRRLLDHLQTLLEGVVAAPEARLSELALLGPDERQRVLVEWNDTAVAYPQDQCLPELLERQVELTPDAPALQFETEQLTYGELNARVNQLAHLLRARGVGPNVLVGLSLERSVEMVVGILGIVKAGGAYVPIDPTHPEKRIALMMEDAATSVLVTVQSVLGRLPEGAASVVCLDRDQPELQRQSAENADPIVRPDDLAYMIYTSGSTGRPKGAMISHRAIINRLRWMQDEYGLTADDRVLQKTPFSFDVSVWEFFWPLITGARLVVARPEGHRDPEYLARTIVERGVTTLHFVPSMLRAFLSAPHLESVDCLKRVICSGEALLPDLCDAFVHRIDAELHNLYGPTEAAVDVTAHRCDDDDRFASVPIGRPIANTTAYVLDAAMRPVPVGVGGELFIGGVQLARGYFGQPGLTAERFVPDPFGEGGARLYRTGDHVRYRTDGNIEFLGRLDHQVKLRGFRIELGEIETALRSHDDVDDAVAIVRQNESGEKRLVAYVVAAPPHELSRGVLRERLAERLPSHMIPSAIVFLDAMPLTPSGKVDRRALPDPSTERQAAGEFVAPRSDIEVWIAAIWGDVLGVDRVGATDNFFELGGDSLLLMQVHARLVEKLDREFSLVALFQYPTVVSLAGFLGDGAKEEGSYLRAARERRAEGAEARVTEREAVAIIGMAGRFPGASNVEQFWDNLCGGVESISRFDESELCSAGIDEHTFRDSAYVPAKGVLDEADHFDATFFGYSPREAEIIDPQQRVILECAWSALEAAGYDPERYGGRIGVYAGSSSSTYLRGLRANPEIMASTDPLTLLTGNGTDFVATRIAYKLNLCGPAVNVRTACSTSLVAVHEACKSLLAGECSIALAGGVRVSVPLKAGYRHQEGGILSRDGHCRTFDADASGTVGGNGVGMVVLKCLADAVADGDRIHAVVLGSAVNNDGATKVGFTAPSVEGQAEVIADALCAADVDPATIDYVETHGTATELGDPIEVAVLTEVFTATTDRRQYCALGTLKPNVGHMDTAAGIGGLIKSALSVEHGKIPPSLHYRTPNPRIDIENSPFFVNTVLRDWEPEGHPRRAGVTSLGMGGTNVHAVLEQAPVLAPSGPARDWQLLVLSAKSLTALEQQAANLAAHLRTHPNVSLADVAHTLQVGRAEFEHRRAVAARSTSEAGVLLDGADPAAIVTRRAVPAAHPVVFMFPGQGAQYVDMGRGLYEGERAYREVVDRSLALLRDEMGLDLFPLLYPAGDAPPDAVESLKRTEIAQPALFVVEYALAELWRSWGVEPEACIGHSIGEYVAAVVSGVLRWEDALRLVALRGRLMGEMPAGVMTAVPLPKARVRELLASATDLWLSVVNAPSMCVVSGVAERVAAFEAQLQERDGIECRRLHTSHAFHSGLMDGAVQPFVEAVREVSRHAPGIPYVSNVTGTWITEEDVLDASYWGRHIRHAVLFSEGLAHLLENPNRVLLEVGPGEVLGALARRQPGLGAERVVVPSLRGPNSSESSEADAALLMRALGRLWTGGVAVDWTRYRDGERRRRVTLPTYPFQRNRFWIDPRPSSASPTHTSLDKWFHVPAWQRTSPPAALEGPDAPACLVFADASPLSTQVVDALRRAGCGVTIVEPGPAFAEKGSGYVIAPAAPEDYERLLRHVIAAGHAPDRVVHLWNAAPDEGWLGDDAARNRVDQGFYSVLYLAQALGGANDPGPLHVDVVTTGVHEVTGQETLQPEKALLLGPGRVIGQEFIDVTCRMIDLAAEEIDDASACLTREILSSADDTLVAYRRGRRYLETFARVPLAKPSGLPRPLREGGTYLITGGLGGIGLELAKDLARTASANVVLTSRTALPARDAWAEHLERHGEDDTVSQRIRAVEAMEQAGGNVMVAAADVADADAMRAIVVEAERRFGAVHGVVHAAGVAGGGVILLKSRDEAERVLRPKVAGARVLHQLFAERKLDFMVLCSSVTAVLGNAGQVDYCGANAYLDAFARRFGAETGVFTVSIGWNRWREVGMAVDTARRLGHGRALTGASNAEGVDAFRRILDAGAEPHVVVYERDLLESVTADAALAPGAAAGDGAGAAPTAMHGRPDIGVSYVAPCTDTERVLAEIWQRLLGIEQIGIHDNFFELGGDSVLNLQIVRQAKEAGLAITPTAVFDHQTVAALAAATGRADAPAEVPTESDNTTDAQKNANGEPGADQPGRLSAASLSERDLAAISRQLGRGSDAD